MLDLLLAFLEILFHATSKNKGTDVSRRFFVKILVMICGYAVLREALPFDETTSSYWSIIITASLVALYYLFQILRRHTQPRKADDLVSPSDSSENIN